MINWFDDSKIKYNRFLLCCGTREKKSASYGWQGCFGNKMQWHKKVSDEDVYNMFWLKKNQLNCERVSLKS